ncbi:MAG: hypothetical protein EBR72_08060 [Bacteroidetes bacterium]|jgi:hypothetical protein|nr:hypothetical protein [Bacteroidota bacterium]
MSNTDIVYIDDCFYVEEKYGLWMSTLKDGEKLVTSLSKQLCIDHTRFFLKGRQEGWGIEQSRVVNDGKVGGKL